ncbi:MAG: YgiQ family radical SAM protein [Victivallales bacterium]|nr:YgiQ family radical SAM protein [Victivallales bacterium]
MSIVSQPKIVPITRAETEQLGWQEIDVLLVTGDAFVDHPSYGIAIIARLLLSYGYRVAVIAQPDWKDSEALKVFGRPRICCGITSGNMDSMVNLYTAGRRLRREDSYSLDGTPGSRPHHALVVYSQLARQCFPGIPIVIGGLEASLRRIAHYDYWQDKIRPSMLVDSKANILMYGQGEKSLREVYRRIEQGEDLRGIPGTAVLLGKKAAEEFDPGDRYVEIPTYAEHLVNRDALMVSTKTIEREMNPWCGHGIIQRYDDRLLVIERPSEPMSTEESDQVHALPYSGLPHPSYQGRKIPAFETIKNSIPAVRGCPGGCSFCGLVSHQGRLLTFRSEKSIVDEVERMKQRGNFNGTISDIGGPAGNIYGNHPNDPEKCKVCRRSSCLYPNVCKNYNPDGKRLIGLLRQVRSIPGVKHVHINSGVRLALALLQPELTRELIQHHISGHLKVAPEHLHPRITALMRKDPPEAFFRFMKIFEEESRKAGKKQYLIPLFISNFPGTTDKEMKVVDDFLTRHHWSPQQVQDYIPLPMTMAAAMYYTGKDPAGEPIHVNRGLKERRPQIKVLKRNKFGAPAASSRPQPRRDTERPAGKERRGGKK